MISLSIPCRPFRRKRRPDAHDAADDGDCQPVAHHRRRADCAVRHRLHRRRIGCVLLSAEPRRRSCRAATLTALLPRTLADDNWQACGSYGPQGFTYHDINGRPVINKERFPDMLAMTNYAHSLGLTAGWCELFRSCIAFHSLGAALPISRTHAPRCFPRPYRRQQLHLQRPLQLARMLPGRRRRNA